jgi:hypothetical protein
VARKKTSKTRVNVKASISKRLREIRQELFGEHGGPELARRLNLPARTWYNYETGVTVPAEVLLGFIDQTGANPVWLLSGEGEHYRREVEAAAISELTPIELIRRGLEKLEQEPGDVAGFSPEGHAGASSEFIAVSLIRLADLALPFVPPDRVLGQIQAYREWLPHPRETVAVRLDDDAMFPILPTGSVVAVDRSLTDPSKLQGKMVATNAEGTPMIRWLDLTGRHLIFRPNQPSRDYPLVPRQFDETQPSSILGQVVWSWSCFNLAER